MAVGAARPSAMPDNPISGGPARAGKYGEAYGIGLGGKEWPLSDEGSYYTARDATPGTGKISGVVTTFVETTPYLIIYNGSTSLSIYPQFIRFHVTVVSTNSTRVQFTTAIDTGNRFSSGGAALTLQNTNMNSPNASQAVINTGVLVATTATANRRVLDHVNFRGSIDVVEDSYELVFGPNDGPGNGGSRVATVADLSKQHSPVVIGPGQSFLLYEWSTSQSVGITMETTIGYVER